MLDRVHDLYDELDRRRLIFALKEQRSAGVDRSRSHLDGVNSARPDDLHDRYREQLADGTHSPAGGNGLRMIDIVRHSSGKLEHAFVPCDRENAFFSLNVNMTT